MMNSTKIAQNIFLSKDYIEIQKMLKELEQFTGGGKSNKIKPKDLIEVKNKLKTISIAIFSNADVYQYRQKMHEEILTHSDPLTFYNALKVTSTLAMDSENCEGLSEHYFAIELLRDYFLNIHHFSLERPLSFK